jgi:hypothetical protein
LLDNATNNKETKDVSLVPTSQIYDDSDKLLGKDYKKFSLPEKITVYDFDDIYTLNCNVQQYNDADNDVREIYKKFYGDKYDEKQLTADNGGLIYQDGTNSSSFWGMDLILTLSDYKTAKYDSDENPITNYYISDTQSDVSFDLNGKQINVGEETDYINTYLSDLLAPMYSDYSLVTKGIYTEKVDDDTRIDFICSETYEGIPIQYNHSEYAVSDNYGNLNYWLVAQVSGSVEDDNKFTFVNAGVPYTVVDKTKQENLVPFSKAIEIMENELAENVHLDFVNAELMYCCLTEQPSFNYTENVDVSETEKLTAEYNKQIKIFEPTWCFEIKSDTLSTTKEYVKINALTGEIYMDVL